MATYIEKKIIINKKEYIIFNVLLYLKKKPIGFKIEFIKFFGYR